MYRMYASRITRYYVTRSARIFASFQRERIPSARERFFFFFFFFFCKRRGAFNGRRGKRAGKQAAAVTRNRRDVRDIRDAWRCEPRASTSTRVKRVTHRGNVHISRVPRISVIFVRTRINKAKLHEYLSRRVRVVSPAPSSNAKRGGGGGGGVVLFFAGVIFPSFFSHFIFARENTGNVNGPLSGQGGRKG